MAREPAAHTAVSPEAAVHTVVKVACALVLRPVEAAVDGAALLVLVEGSADHSALRPTTSAASRSRPAATLVGRHMPSALSSDSWQSRPCVLGACHAHGSGHVRMLRLRGDDRMPCALCMACTRPVRWRGEEVERFRLGVGGDADLLRRRVRRAHAMVDSVLDHAQERVVTCRGAEVPRCRGCRGKRAGEGVRVTGRGVGVERVRRKGAGEGCRARVRRKGVEEGCGGKVRRKGAESKAARTDGGRGGGRAKQQRPRERAECDRRGAGVLGGVVLAELDADLRALFPRALRDRISRVAPEGNLLDLRPRVGDVPVEWNARVGSGRDSTALARVQQVCSRCAAGVPTGRQAAAHVRAAWPNSWPQPKATPTRSADSTTAPHDAIHSMHSSPCSSYPSCQSLLTMRARVLTCAFSFFFTLRNAPG